MFSVVQSKNRPAVPKNNHIMQPPRGFAVRVFKGPTLSSFPYTASAKFDVGYRPTVNSDPRQSQNWYCPRPEPPRAPLSNSREPSKAPRFDSWTENRSTRSAATANYVDFIYERSLSSKSDIYSNSENDTSSTTASTPTSLFSPALSGDSSLTSAPSQIPSQSPTTSSSTITPSSPRTFPLHIPALAQAQSAIRGLFAHPNSDIPQSNPSPPVPPAPVSRNAALPDTASPPRFLPPDTPGRTTSPLSESPQPASFSLPSDYFLPPASESEVGEAQRLAERNAQYYNSASSTYYQAGLRPADNQPSRDGPQQSPERAAQMGSSARSVASSSFPTDSIDSQNHIVYESSSLITDDATFLNMSTEPASSRPPLATSPPRVAFVSSESSSITAVDSDPRRRDSYILDARNVPVSQLVEIDVPGERNGRGERERVLSDPGRYEELRGLTILSDRQREAYVNAFAPGTQQSRSGQRPSPSMFPQIPAVVRSDSSGSTSRGPAAERPRRMSGNLWNSLPQLPDRQSPTQIPSRPSSTPPLPRIDTSRSSAVPPPPAPRPVSDNNTRQPRGPDVPTQQRSPPRRDTPAMQPQPLPAPAVNPTRSRTPVAGPRTLPAEPQRRRSDGDQPILPSLLKRTSAKFHKDPVPESAPRPSRSGALPLDPQRRRSDGFQSVVPPRPPTPVLASAAPRNVRWNENLVCPSPIFASQRRKGWFNRRGDQLWTNDGAYKLPPPGQDFPPDLRDYPAYGSGWMNEDGVRIDMGHRLIPKAPLRSALKQTQPVVIQVEQGR